MGFFESMFEKPQVTEMKIQTPNPVVTLYPRPMPVWISWFMEGGDGKCIDGYENSPGFILGVKSKPQKQMFSGTGPDNPPRYEWNEELIILWGNGRQLDLPGHMVEMRLRDEGET